jgi:prepilin-type processing-associated H-X9-DG protein
VVVTIIALLLATVSPAMNRILLLGKINQCKMNLHNMGTATAAYSAENRNYVPRDGFPSPSQPAHYVFSACLSKYINGKVYATTADMQQNWNYVYDFCKGEKTFLCPMVDQYAYGDIPYVLNYVINALDFEQYSRLNANRVLPAPKGSSHPAYYGDGAPASRLTNLPAGPAEILYIVEFNPGYCAPKNFTVFDVFQPYQMPFDKLTPRGSTQPRMIHALDMRHDGETTIVFFDGHAETRDLDPYQVPVSLWNPLDKTYDPD